MAVKELVLGKLLRYETKQGVVHFQFQGHNFEMFSDELNRISNARRRPMSRRINRNSVLMVNALGARLNESR